MLGFEYHSPHSAAGTGHTSCLSHASVSPSTELACRQYLLHRIKSSTVPDVKGGGYRAH